MVSVSSAGTPTHHPFWCCHPVSRGHVFPGQLGRAGATGRHKLQRTGHTPRASVRRKQQGQ